MNRLKEEMSNTKRYYLDEFELFDGEEYIKFNIIDINQDFTAVTLAITNRGKISVIDYELRRDDKGLYFEYGADLERIGIDDFEEVE